MNRTLDVTSSVAATLFRAGAGAAVSQRGARPAKLLELYEFESCPYCRKVREALSVLDLDAVIYPCPKGGPRFRPALIARGGKAQFPYLVDPNTGKEMYESDQIVRYLFAEYGDGRVPPLLAGGALNQISGTLASLARAGGGTYYRSARPPEQPLELFSFEASPFCRIAREALCELELPYRLRNVARGSAKRPELEQRAGKVMVPFLVDPNTGISMFESADIVAYLHDTYASD